MKQRQVPRLIASLAAAAMGLALTGLQAQPVYRSVGPDGRVTFSDKPEPAAKAVPPAAATEGTGSAALPYEQGTFVRRCVVPVVLAAALLCIAVLGLKRWITPGLVHPASDVLNAWIFAAIWCVVNPLLGWSMIEMGWFKPKNIAPMATNERVKSVRRHYEFWGLLTSGAITSALLVAVINYWLARLYTSPGLYVVPLRVYRAAQAFEVPETAAYAGCKSWVELDQDLLTDGAAPVLGDEAWRDLRRTLDRLLEPTALA